MIDSFDGMTTLGIRSWKGRKFMIETTGVISASEKDGWNPIRNLSRIASDFEMVEYAVCKIGQSVAVNQEIKLYGN